jgi:Ser/Thr protein kinase RdoA (MazF antagonist)
MGITTYLFHRSECLDEQRFNMFFLDMGENIHVHYRDLRIELSVPEFVELAELFNTYAKNVLQEITDGYRDGVLANTNEIGTLKTFWDKEKPLTHPVHYHERQLAIEETKDGYHLHIRNYKLLLGKASFQALAQAMAGVDYLLRQPQLKRDPLVLLQQNELFPRLVSRTWINDREEFVIAVSKTYRKKASQVLRAIGYSHQGRKDNAELFIKAESSILLSDPADNATPSASGSGSVLHLPHFLSTYGASLDAEQLNQLKLRVLFLLKQSENGRFPSFCLEDIYVNGTTLTPILDFFASSSSEAPENQIEAFNTMLVSHKLFFIKPKKHFFPLEKAATVQDAFFRFINETIARHDFVRKIIVLGSSTNKNLGSYSVPFIHFDWAKINSDFDIYVELDPDYQGPLPDNWLKKFHWPRAGSDYYHFGDVGDGMASEFATTYPGICFYEHLVEGYLFDYHHGDKTKRNAWLKEVKGTCIFRNDKTAQWLSRNYPIQAIETEPFNVASFNKVYMVQASGGPYVLKRYGSTYMTAKDRERVSYEIGLLDFLKDRDLNIALPVKSNKGTYLSQLNGEQAVLFTCAPGNSVAEPNELQIRAAGRLLARFHLAAQSYRTKRAKKFRATDPLLYWLDAWHNYRADGIVGTDIDLDINGYRKRIQHLNTVAGHCHGDLSVVNYLFDDAACWLIDFQSVCYGPLVVDLANAMVEFSARKDRSLATNMALFREGYEEKRPLTVTETTSLTDMLIIQAIVRQAKLIRLHFGGFGYDLKEERLRGLKKGVAFLLGDTNL